MTYDTLTLKIPYPGLKKTILYLVNQSAISVKYCAQRWGTKNDLNEIWNIGKTNLIYENDKNNIEQIQSVGTLFENNIHGRSGMGDCDCFTVFGIAMLAANGYDIDNTKIILQGNKPGAPSHIFLSYEDKFFDFTEPLYNSNRNYKFYQIVNI